MRRSPCKDCPRRFAGCHSICPEYAAFREQIASDKKKIESNKSVEGDVMAHQMNTHFSIQRAKKRHKRHG